MARRARIAQEGFYAGLLSIRRLAAAVVISLVALALPARADVQEKTITVRGITVHYKVVLPNG